MPPKRPILLFAFANDEAYRLRLEAEERALREALAEADRRQEVEYKPIGQVNLDDIYNAFNNFNNQIYIFHYGGHSDSEFLHLSGGHARSESLATLIGQQKYLKLFFFNGCSNRAQVEALFAKGVPAVIATSAPVGDDAARQLAEQFYKALAGGKTIKQAFEAAASYVKNKKPELNIRYRGVSFDEMKEDGFPWGLYAREETSLDWHFGLVEQESNLEILARLREASRKRYRAFTGVGGRYQYLRIDEALLAGIENTREGEARKLINTKIGEDKTPLEQSLEALWSAECPHALLVGAGGMGKTVSLIQLWEHYLDTERTDWPSPVFIPLNEFNNRPKEGFIRNYIKEHYGGEDIDRLLKEPLQIGDTSYPHLILLLDGFNEVTASSNELILEINELRAPDKYPGIQLVLSSRVDMRQTYQWQKFHLLELQPLSDEQIETFLKQPLPTDTRLLELLRNPMMLSIYAAQTELPQRYQNKKLLKENVTSTGEMLFNVEMLQRIKIEELFFAHLREQAFRRFVLEHLLPAIGWQMQQAGLFFLEKKSSREGQLGMEEAMQQAITECLTDDFFDTFPFFSEHLEEEHFEEKPRKLFHSIVDRICCRDLALLVAEDGNYRFLHQNFRDYFVARYAQNQIRIALQQKVLPDVLKKVPLDFYVRHLLGELEGEHTNKMKWLEKDKKWQWSKGQFFLDNHLNQLLELCRGVFNKEQLGYTVWNILTIWREQRGELSGADLRQLTFHSFSFNGLRVARPALPACFSEGIITKENLFPQGHSSGVGSTTYSPDGTRIITSSSGIVKIWNAQIGQCLLTLEDPDGLASPGFSRDGAWIVTNSGRNTIKIWDAQTGTCLLRLKDHSFSVYSATFSPDGTRIVTSSFDPSKIWDVQTERNFSPMTNNRPSSFDLVKVWNVQTGTCLLTLEGHSDRVKSAAYSPDGLLIVTSSFDNTAKVWNAQTGVCLMTLVGHSEGVYSAAFSPNGARIITSTSDLVKIWDVQTGACLLTLVGHSEGVYSAAFSPDGSRIVIGSYDNNTVKIWDVQTGQCLMTLEGHSSGVSSAAYSPDGSRIVTGSLDKTVKVWDVQTGQCLMTLEGHSEGVWSTVYKPDGLQLVIGSFDHTAKVWDTQTGQCLMTLVGHSKEVYRAAFSPNGSRIVTSSGDHTARVWNTQTGQCLMTLEDHLKDIWGITYSPNGKQIVAGLGDGMTKAWDALTGACLMTLKGHLDGISSTAYSPDGLQIVTGSFDDTVKVWDIQTGACLLTLKGLEAPNSATYSPDGLRIVIGSLNDNMADVWDAQTGACLLTLEGHSSGVNSTAYSPDGLQIVTGSSDNTAKIWDAQTGRCLLTLEGHSSGVNDIDFSPDGLQIATGSSDNTTKIWDAQTGQCLLSLPDIPGLLIHGCDFRNLHPDSELSKDAVALLRQYGGIFDDEDARRWARLCRKHGLPLPPEEDLEGK